MLHFLPLRIQQPTLSGCKSWRFVIYNQFSACPSSFFCLQFRFCPKGPCSIPSFHWFNHSLLTLDPTFSISLLSSPRSISWSTLNDPIKCFLSCAGSGNCVQWNIIREPREQQPTLSQSSCRGSLVVLVLVQSQCCNRNDSFLLFQLLKHWLYRTIMLQKQLFQHFEILAL